MDPVRRRRLKAWILVGVIVLALGFDLSRAPADQLSARFLLGAIHLYQATLSQRMGSLGVRCRFQPTCSES